MKQYGVYRLKDNTNFVIILQYPGLETSSLVIVAPLIDADALPEITPMTPILRYKDQAWMVLTYRMAAIPEADLGEYITSFHNIDYVFQWALSRLFYGN